MEILSYIAMVILLLMIWAIIETRLLKTSRFTVSDPDIPKEADGKVIVQLSDLHGISFGRDNSRLIRMVEECHPDYIVISGDIINGRTRRLFGYADSLLEKLAGLGVPVIYTYGNHEMKLQLIDEDAPDEYGRIAQKHSVVINNSHVSFDDGLCFFGLNLPLDYYHANLKLIDINLNEALGFPDKNCYNILIAHDPTFKDFYLKWNPKLIFSGHYHGGIIRLPFLGGVTDPRLRLFPKYDKGLYRFGSTYMMVSGGIGWHTLPFRFINRPEIVEVKLSRHESSGKA